MRKLLLLPFACLLAASCNPLGAGKNASQIPANYRPGVEVAALQIVQGDKQSGAIQKPLKEDILLKVLDKNDAAVVGIEVEFKVLSGEGTLKNDSLISDAKGQVKNQWTLGPLTGAQAIQASVKASSLTTVVNAQAKEEVSVTYTLSASRVSEIPSQLTLEFSKAVYDFVLSDLVFSAANGKRCHATLDSLDHNDGEKSATLHFGGTLNNWADVCDLAIKAGAVKLEDQSNPLLLDSELTLTVDLVVDLLTELNSYAAVTNASVANGATSLEVDNASAFKVGDLVMVIQMQNAPDPNSVGQYDFVHLAEISGNELHFNSSLTNSYTSAQFDSSTAQAAQVIRVPEFTNLKIEAGASLTAPAWNGQRGGIVILRAENEIDILGEVDLSEKGFRGGAPSALQDCADMPLVSSQAGESLAGLGQANTQANFGGGGAGNSGVCGHGTWLGAGGGGGASFGASGEDRSAYDDPPQVLQGSAGALYGSGLASKLYLGSGGGAGGAHDAGTASAGGAGGGALYASARIIHLTGAIIANGQAGVDAIGPSAAGGGGSGGSVYLAASERASLGAELVEAVGGLGGSVPNNETNYIYRFGGNGGQGHIHVQSPLITGSTNPVHN